MLIVQKFGGSSVADAPKIANVANRITEAKKNGHDVIAVVSAPGDTTDHLLAKIKEINSKASKRETDVLLACGEQIAISLLAAAIEKLNFSVVSLTGWQAGFKTDSVAGNARITSIDTKRITTEIQNNNIVIVAGFQGVDREQNITTLGRGGSDTSAVALAAALDARFCEIYTDVDGIYTADPRFFRNAKKLKEITYDEMLELSSLGANVLHNRSVELAKKYNIKLEVKSSFEKTEGTIVKEYANMEGRLIKGVTCDDDVARITIIAVQGQAGAPFKIFSLLANEGINVDIIVQPMCNETGRNISFTTSKTNIDAALKIIDSNKASLEFSSLESDDSLSKVSIVGAGMVNNIGVAANMFEALYEKDIDIHMISTSEIKISVLVKQKDSKTAVNAIHKKFNLKKQ